MHGTTSLQPEILQHEVHGDMAGRRTTGQLSATHHTSMGALHKSLSNMSVRVRPRSSGRRHLHKISTLTDAYEASWLTTNVLDVKVGRKVGDVHDPACRSPSPHLFIKSALALARRWRVASGA